ncbi:hypothetical protein [Myxococcus phage Mx4 ts27htf-1hrm-1]|nr:putative adaptor protein [Myxococcus phage Mx4]WNM70391.1 hypothetical protein [Myxococcus phage Mx4 ts27htf-1hrm-1]
MARYASLQDLYSLGVPQAALEGEASPEEQEQGLEAACDLVDSYLSGRFVLPLTAHGRDLTRAAAIIAAYDLMTGRGYNPANQGDDSTQLDKRYEATIEWLRDIAKGIVKPVVTDSSPTPGGGGAGASGVGDGYVVAPRLAPDGDGYVVGEPRPRGW